MDVPILRQDLRLLPGSRDEAGEKSWLLYDPLRHQYFALTQTALLLLKYLPKISSIGELKENLASENAQVDDYEIEQFVGFLNENFLSVGSDEGHLKRIADAHERRQHHWVMWLVHNYLFIKIPLIRPDGFLAGLLGLVRPLASKPVRYAIYAAGIYGLFALIWQWESFVSTFDYFFNWQGLAYYFLALVGVKIAHELGHALVAKYFGLRVSSMGVALLVLFPVLYTDNTDAWRLTDQRKKLKIVLAGLLVELHIAMLALFSWGILDDGPTKSAAFFLATTSILGSLLVNLSPFMRFDGYYAMADFMGMQNLQPRAFELARWQLRQWLFGLPENAPEPFPIGKHYFLVLYSFATWIYRLFLFIGIALLVYFLAFKILGIILFIIEVVWFILRPVYTEMRRWWAKRALFSFNRQTRRTLLVFLTFLLIAFVPWRSNISAPAIVESVRQIPIYLPEAARIAEVHVKPEQRVKKGQVLASATSPDIENQISLLRRRVRLLQLEVNRYANSPSGIRNKLVSEQKLIEVQSRLAGFEKRKAGLELRAPEAGIIQLTQNLTVGRWMLPSDQMFFIFEPHDADITAFVNEKDMRLVLVGQAAKFIPNDGVSGIHYARVFDLETAAAETITYGEVTSQFGGPIAVESNDKPKDAYYKGRAVIVSDAPRLSRNVAGIMYIDTEPFAPARRFWDGLMALLVRESGF